MHVTGFWYGPIVQQTRGFLYWYCPNGLTNGLLSATCRREWRFWKLHLWGIVRVFKCICIRIDMISESSTCILALGLDQQKILKSIHNKITTIKSYMHVLNTGLCVSVEFVHSRWWPLCGTVWLHAGVCSWGWGVYIRISQLSAVVHQWWRSGLPESAELGTSVQKTGWYFCWSRRRVICALITIQEYVYKSVMWNVLPNMV